MYQSYPQWRGKAAGGPPAGKRRAEFDLGFALHAAYVAKLKGGDFRKVVKFKGGDPLFGESNCG